MATVFFLNFGIYKHDLGYLTIQILEKPKGAQLVKNIQESLFSKINLKYLIYRKSATGPTNQFIIIKCQLAQI